IWHPDSASLRTLRERITADPEGWRRLDHALTSSGFAWAGDRLVRAPRGFAKDDPMIEHLLRKDAIVTVPLTVGAVTADDFLGRVVGLCTAGAPLVADQCATLELPW